MSMHPFQERRASGRRALPAVLKNVGCLLGHVKQVFTRVRNPDVDPALTKMFPRQIVMNLLHLPFQKSRFMLNKIQ